MRRRKVPTNDKTSIVDHYNRVSPYYRALWGEHLHHGYWIRGDESKEIAQLQLVEYLAEAAGIRSHARILDIGCGFGASSIYLARKFQAQTTGISNSPVQVEMARQAAARASVPVDFFCMDAESIAFAETFDTLWSIESISHYQDVPGFFLNAAKLLDCGGTIALTDWFRKESVSPREQQKFLRPIEAGMLVKLHSMPQYEAWLTAAGFSLIRSEILNPHVSKTWELCLDIIRDKSLWKLAAMNGSEFLRFLDAFRAMRAGFASNCFVYGLLVAKTWPGAR
jgi:tocopherol O-methyltransferase